MINAQRYIIASALEDETQGLEEFAPVVHTGVGKINACLHLYDAILKYKPDLVINYGTAGSLGALSGLHKVHHFIQADMDVRGLNVPRGITPFSEEQLPNKHGVVLATSDSFITNSKKQLEGLEADVDLVDMEAYAMNKVCQHLNVAFESYKWVSDNANEEAGVDWKESVSNGTQCFKELLEQQFGLSQITS
jgi:adenosylhomocysteine nucleosidase